MTRKPKQSKTKKTRNAKTAELTKVRGGFTLAQFLDSGWFCGGCYHQ